MDQVSLLQAQDCQWDLGQTPKGATREGECSAPLGLVRLGRLFTPKLSGESCIHGADGKGGMQEATNTPST